MPKFYFFYDNVKSNTVPVEHFEITQPALEIPVLGFYYVMRTHFSNTVTTKPEMRTTLHCPEQAQQR